jgi:hypothetical protein
MKNSESEKTILCPSARVETENSKVFGIIRGTVELPQVTYLEEPIPLTEDLLQQIEPVTPTEVFRLAGTCATHNCEHFDGKNCRLAERVVANISTVAEDLPPCSIRRYCRWWQQEGKAACLRCPQVITDNYITSDLLTQVAGPSY